MSREELEDRVYLLERLMADCLKALGVELSKRPRFDVPYPIKGEEKSK